MTMFSESRITDHESRVTDLRSALRDGIAQLECEHVPSAVLAAELLLMHTLGRDRAWLYAHPEHELEAAQRERYLELVARRASGVPTQYLTGHQEFWGLDFEVTPDVLIPRPETEHVIEVALERLVTQAPAGPGSNGPVGACATQQFRIADVGTGSGCIAVALAHELPAAKLIATETSSAALAVARRNASRHEVSSRIEFIECNLLEALLHGSRATVRGSRPFDLIVSNPPYIGRAEAASLPREVREHEPEAALLGGDAGSEMYAPLIAQAAKLLMPGGFLVLELGHNSARDVSQLLAGPEWTDFAITNDLAGIPRVAAAGRSLHLHPQPPLFP
jgi:release factor glutamine methyltransferase